jgi:hypothetical protein
MRAGRHGLYLGLADVRRLLAHREPFLFLDCAKENVIGKSIIGVMRLRADAEYPPSRSILLEAMGQASALVIRQVRDASSTKHSVSVGLSQHWCAYSI